jgi:uncharacterized glyoxalase superfamily protein PhnB
MTKTLQPRIHPAIRYTDAHRAVDWLARAFGFEKRVVHEGANGSIAHAEMTYGSSVVGFSSAHAVDPANPWTMVKQGIYVALNDIDAHHEQASAAGAEIVRPLRDESYGSRDYSARDLDGHLWAFGTYRMIENDDEQAFSVGLHYQDGAAALEWLERAFGFRKTLEVRGDDGAIVHAEMRFGADALMIDGGPRDAKIWGDVSQFMSVRVDDPDAHHQRACSEDAEIVAPLATKPWARGYCARDFEGLLWSFSTYEPAR